MTNKQLLRKILSDRPIEINTYLPNDTIKTILFLKDIFTLRDSHNNNLGDSLDIMTLFETYDYIYYKSKGKNSRRIKKGKHDVFTRYHSLTYKEIIILQQLLDEDCDLELLVQKLKGL